MISNRILKSNLYFEIGPPKILTKDGLRCPIEFVGACSKDGLNFLIVVLKISMILMNFLVVLLLMALSQINPAATNMTLVFINTLLRENH